MAFITSVLLILSFLVGYLFKFPSFDPAISLSILDISVVIIFVISLAKKKFRFSLPKSLTVFLFFCVLSLVISKDLSGIPYLFRFFVYTSLPYVLTISPSFAKRLFHTLCLIVVLTGIFQYFAFPDVRSLAAFGWDDHYYRIVGTFLDPGFTGLIIVLFLVSLPTGLTWAVAYLALSLTYSRSSYLAFIFSARSLSQLLVYLMLIGATVLLVPRPAGEGVKLERTSSVNARIINWTQSWTIFQDHFLTGVGFNNYRKAQHRYRYISDSDWQTTHSGAGADSSLLFVAATTGILGLFSYLYYLWSLATRHPQIVSYLVPVLLHSFFLNSLFYPPILLLLALVMVSNGQSVRSFRNFEPDR